MRPLTEISCRVGDVGINPFGQLGAFVSLGEALETHHQSVFVSLHGSVH